MKKLWTVFAAILCLLLVLVLQMPCKTVVTTETLSSIQNDSNNYPEELSNAISRHLFDSSSFPTFADSVYIIREEYLIKKDKTTYFVPYMRANVDDVGIAGTSTWVFWLNTLVLDEDGAVNINANKKYNRSASTFIVEADPNTAIREPSFFDENLDNVVSIVLEKNEWYSMDEYAFSIHAATLDSEKTRNVDSVVSCRWESSLSYRVGKEVPFVVEAEVSYINNYKG